MSTIIGDLMGPFVLQSSVERKMERETIIDRAKEYISQLFKGNSGGHDVEHTMRVYRNAMMIAEKEGVKDKLTIALGALLHDADDYKLFNTENNRNARTFLQANGMDQAGIERICRMIEEVSFSKNKGSRPSSLEAMIVQDADRLDALGAIGIARTFSFGGEHGRSLTQNIDHFHEKLLLLKDLMNTGTAREIAERRHNYMVGFLEEFEAETCP